MQDLWRKRLSFITTYVKPRRRYAFDPERRLLRVAALRTVFLRAGFFVEAFLFVLPILLPAVRFRAALETRVVPAEMDPSVAPIVRATVSRAPSSFALEVLSRFVFTGLLLVDD